MAHHCKPRTHERSENEQAVFQASPPSSCHCCLCKHNLHAETVEELRPTGLVGEVQRWYYCPECYCFYNETCNCPSDSAALASLCRLIADVHCSVKVPTIRVR